MFRNLSGKVGACFLLTFLLVLTLFYSTPNTAQLVSYAEETPTYDIYEFTYVDVATIKHASNVSEGYFEVPINYTEPHYTQVVRVFKVGGDVVINSSGNKTAFRIPISNNTSGYVILNVTITRESSKELGIVSRALYLGDILLYNYPYPEDIVRKYVLQPNEKVVEVVVPLFEEWMRDRLPSNISLSRVSKTYLAVWAAKYLYGDYLIKYKASSIPRSLDEVLEEREGDCDDKSRILLSLLWYYGIPAKIQHGYVHLKFDYVADVYGSLTRFINAGPHAYVVIYVPKVGWVSVDLLAWARLYHPTLITGESTYSSVTSEDLREVEKFYSSFKYLELIEIYESSKLPEDLIRDLMSSDLMGRLERMFDEGPQETNTTTVSSTTPTTYPSTTQIINTHYEETTTSIASWTFFEVFLIVVLAVSVVTLLLIMTRTRR